MNISENLRKEQFSEAFVRAFAAPLGLNPSKPEVDNDSIDLRLSGKDYNGLISSPEIGIQLKCTEQEINEDGFLHFKLKKKNYLDLCNTRVLFPRYLFVFLIPKEVDTWVLEKENSIELQYKGLWFSLKGLPVIETKSKVIKIPSSNVINKEILQKMMFASSSQEVYHV